MAERSKDGRYMPVLAILLLLTLGAAAWWLYMLSFGPAGKPAVVETLVNAQAANSQARKALAGDAEAFAALRNSQKALNGITTETLAPKQKALLGEVRSVVTELLENEGSVVAVVKAKARIKELVAKLADAVYALQGDLAVQRQPAVLANLERMRLLAQSIGLAADGLLDANADLNTRLINIEMELNQLVRALQAGDPQLGLTGVSGAGVDAAVAGVSRRADQLSTAVADGLRYSDQLGPLREAALRLDRLVMSMEGDRIVFGDPTVTPGLDSQVWRLLALLGVAAFLAIVMMALWFRASDQRQKTARLAAATERDQQAILRLLDELSNLADGDLTVQATVGDDITGAIADSINFAVEALRELVTTINKGSILVDDATKQTAASAKALSAASEAQSRQIKEATASIQLMAASIDEVSGNAERSADVARHSVDIAHKGGDAVRRTIEGMNTIRETIQETSKRIKRLGESSQEIGDIVELINDIADQTNILALNASIQASMAGEAGRGFAVVADEVQRLAERSTNATKQIEVLVSTIQADTNEAVVSMERSTTDVVGGALLAENAGAALEEIEQVSNQIAMLVQNISSSAREQSAASRSVLESARQLEAISREADASAATTTNFISKLASLATQLRESAAGFTLPEPDPAQPAAAAASSPGGTAPPAANPTRAQAEAADGYLAKEQSAY
ncbi:MAG: methyl-accepting chemotaxis protein [Gammaproteobacteria bacterium]|jgi:twitching motility protein PilJ|nr:methyl-accepting chemotaxis protein [Gammaproteobacteria bacterium]